MPFPSLAISMFLFPFSYLVICLRFFYFVRCPACYADVFYFVHCPITLLLSLFLLFRPLSGMLCRCILFRPLSGYLVIIFVPFISSIVRHAMPMYFISSIVRLPCYLSSFLLFRPLSGMSCRFITFPAPSTCLPLVPIGCSSGAHRMLIGCSL